MYEKFVQSIILKQIIITFFFFFAFNEITNWFIKEDVLCMCV